MTAQDPAEALMPTAKQEEEDPGFWSIERVVAFVLAPLLMAASAYIAILISTRLPGHPQVSSGAVYAFASTMALGVAGVIAKWLHGRQIVLPDQRLLESQVFPVIHQLALIPGGHEVILELAKHLLPPTVDVALVKGIADAAAAHEAAKPPPIPAALNDPAPATPLS